MILAVLVWEAGGCGTAQGGDMLRALARQTPLEAKTWPAGCACIANAVGGE